MKILFLNGINLNNGGSSSNSFKFWIESLKKIHSVNILESVPKKSNYNILNKIYLFFLFLPGSLLRLFPSLLNEYLIKISLQHYFQIKKKFNLYDKVIISHHSVFYLVFFFKNLNLIVHDLIYVKSINNKNIRVYSKFILWFEIKFLKKADKIFVQSYYEYRILKYILKKTNQVELISIQNFNLANEFTYKTKLKKNFAMISNWRRYNNLISLRDFVNKNKNSRETINIYGYTNFFSKIFFYFMIKYKKKKIKLNFKGSFNDYKDIDEDFMIAANDYGAGIKLKVVEAVANNKLIISTKKSLQGIPFDMRELPIIPINTQIKEFNFDNYKNLSSIEINEYKNLFLLKHDRHFKNIVDVV